MYKLCLSVYLIISIDLSHLLRLDLLTGFVDGDIEVDNALSSDPDDPDSDVEEVLVQVDSSSNGKMLYNNLQCF